MTHIWCAGLNISRNLHRRGITFQQSSHDPKYFERSQMVPGTVAGTSWRGADIPRSR